MSYDSRAGWVVVIPVKPSALAKSRLGVLGPQRRMALAQAFALDTVTALAATTSVRAVLVVTRDHDARETFRRFSKVEVLVDRRSGMNEAIRQGAIWAIRYAPTAAVAVLPADLPAATPELVEVFLARASAHARSVLGDMEMIGTTALTALAGISIEPAFGPGSLQAHLRSGAVLVDGAGLEPLRRDVDIVEHLEAALLLGVGRATRQVVAAEA